MAQARHAILGMGTPERTARQRGGSTRVVARHPDTQRKEDAVSRDQPLLELQRVAGNQAVAGVIRRWQAENSLLRGLDSGRPSIDVQRRVIESGAEKAELEQLDLGSEAGMSESMKRNKHQIVRGEKDKEHHNVTITNAHFVGGYEHAGADHPVPHIRVGDRALAKGGDTLRQLQVDYNAYTPSLKPTLRGMGRLKDLENAGAKLDPAAVEADPALAAKFAMNPGQFAQKDQRAVAFNAWSAEAKREEIAVAKVAAGYQQLRAAITGFRRAEYLLQGRNKQAALEGAEAKKEKIDQTVETLHKIVDVSFKALEGLEQIESFMESGVELKELSAAEEEVAKHETNEQAAESRKDVYKQTRSKQQAAMDAGKWSKDKVAWMRKHAGDWAKEGGLTLDNVLIFATGNAAEYQQLTTQINNLKADLVELKFNEETLEIKEASERLDGMKLEVGIRIREAKADRESARAAAGTFGHVMGGDEGTLAMFAAQAYEDLATFGGAADRQRRTTLDSRLGWLLAFLQNNKDIARGHDWADDWLTLGEWGQNLVEQRDFFSERTPEWISRARAWNEFLARMTGGGLTRD